MEKLLEEVYATQLMIEELRIKEALLREQLVKEIISRAPDCITINFRKLERLCGIEPMRFRREKLRGQVLRGYAAIRST